MWLSLGIILTALLYSVRVPNAAYAASFVVLFYGMYQLLLSRTQ
jgi:hypothetical protein